MRQDHFITITTYRGARHFRLSHRARRQLAAGAAVLALALVIGAAAIAVLTGQVVRMDGQLDTLSAQRDAAVAGQQGLVRVRDDLQRELDRRQRELAALGAEVDHIERLISLEASPERSLVQRISDAGQTALEKRLMLRSVPSGFPVTSETVTSRYGMRLHPIQERDAMHHRVDLRAPRGTPIHATADGVVEWAAFHRDSGLGKMVKLVHNYGFSTIYGHLDQIEVHAGSYVKRGDLLGYSGSTGASTAAHLHYEVRYLQRQLDPAPFLKWSLEEYDGLFTQEDRVQWESLAEVVRTATIAAERPSSQPVQSLSATSP